MASRYFDEDNQIESYSKVPGALREQGVPHCQVPELKMKDPFIRDLRKLAGKAASVEGMRLGGQSFGDRFIEDGYVYRIY